jgi:hypothetical protein
MAGDTTRVPSCVNLFLRHYTSASLLRPLPGGGVYLLKNMGDRSSFTCEDVYTQNIVSTLSRKMAENG